MDFVFRVAPEVFARFPRYVVVGVLAVDLHNAPEHPEVTALLTETAAAVRAQFQDHPPSAHPTIRAWHQALRQLGLDPAQYPPSVEALVRRVLAGDPPRVNAAVDLANAISLRYLVPVGAHDLDRLRSPFAVRFSQPGDTFVPLGQSEAQPVPPGEIVYADALMVRTRRWVWRMGELGKVRPESRTVFFPIDAFAGLDDIRAQQAAAELADRAERWLGARTTVVRVDQTRPEVVLSLPERAPDAIEWVLTRGVAEILPSRAELERALRSGRRLHFYMGVDPTSPQLHLGHAVALRKLRQLQDLGHRITLLIGDFTARIGDPTERAEARRQLTREEVEANARTYRDQAARILDFTSPTNPVELRYNGEWWDRMGTREIIELAAHFTVQQMIQREMFQRRLAENRPIFLHEFLYPLLQGYDSVALDVDGELGGTDQTFNMLCGRTLLKDLRNKEKFIITVPLLEGTDGRKMSKSYGNVIAVTDPPYDMYGKIMSLRDELILKYFELLTDVPEAELAEMARQLAAGTVNPMLLKKRLAHEIVTLFHGPEAAAQAAERFEREVQRREIPAEMPTCYLPRDGEWALVDLLVACALASSRSEAKRLIEQGSVAVDQQRITDPRARVVVREGMVIRGRRRQFARISLSPAPGSAAE